MIVLKEEFELRGCTAIVPSVGVGNVAQLSIDLIVASLKLRRIGSGWHLALMPVFGPPAYDHDTDSRSVSFEVYSDLDKKLIVFQIRSPLIQQFTEDFHEKLVQFLVEKHVSRVIILTSSHAYEKHSIESSPFEYLCNSQFKTLKIDKIKQINWKEFEGTIIHGGGNAKNLLEACTKKDVPALVLFKYVSEGDNSPDAAELVGELNKLCGIFEKGKGEKEQVKLTVPISWRLLFGNDPPELIF